MFNKLLKGLTGKPPLPDVEVVGYEFETVSFTCPQPLQMGLCEANGKLPNGDVINLHLLIESFLEDKGVYWAQLVNKEHDERLMEIFPPPTEEELAAAEEPVVEWTEKREIPRVSQVLGAMCPLVTGFKCLTYDLTLVGTRLMSDNQLPEGKVIKFRVELDDARLQPMELKGLVVWSQPHPKKGFWAGILFQDMPEAQHAVLEKYLKEVGEVEHGVFTRGYSES